MQFPFPEVWWYLTNQKDLCDDLLLTLCMLSKIQVNYSISPFSSIATYYMRLSGMIQQTCLCFKFLLKTCTPWGEYLVQLPRSPLGYLQAMLECLTLNPGSPTSNSLLLMCSLGGNRWWVMCLSPCHLYERLIWCSRLQLQSGPSSIVGIWGNEPAGRNICFCLGLSCFWFSNKNKCIKLDLKRI